MAVVGSGPSAFYCMKYIFENRKDIDFKIDIFEKLPMPFGLVRYGVAPDHQEVKTCINLFHDIASNPKVRFFGNVEVSSNLETNVDNDIPSIHISIDDLRNSYDAIILAYGASADNSLGILGEDVDGIVSARAFVNWYNGHPNYTSLDETLMLDKVENVVIIGQGNVAIDCARILSKEVDETENDELSSFDIPDRVLNALKSSNVKNITIIGRRGHVQASFTIKELRELSKLKIARLFISKLELQDGLTEESELEIVDNRPKKRITDLMESIAITSAEINEGSTHTVSSYKRNMFLRFLCSPIKFNVHAGSSGTRVSSVTVERNRLEGQAFEQTSVGTGQYEELKCELVLKSVGYRSIPMIGIPFDYISNTIPNCRGKVVDTENGDSNAQRLYVTGWLKRGPTGIIGTNIVDAKETVSTIFKDIESGNLVRLVEDDIDPIENIPNLKSHLVVTWKDFIRLDGEEKYRGKMRNPPKIREKFTNTTEIIDFLKK